jgi:hypothetical protein
MQVEFVFSNFVDPNHASVFEQFVLVPVKANEFFAYLFRVVAIILSTTAGFGNLLIPLRQFGYKLVTVRL